MFNAKNRPNEVTLTHITYLWRIRKLVLVNRSNYLVQLEFLFLLCILRFSEFQFKSEITETSFSSQTSSLPLLIC